MKPTHALPWAAQVCSHPSVLLSAVPVKGRLGDGQLLFTYAQWQGGLPMDFCIALVYTLLHTLVLVRPSDRSCHSQ